MNNELGNGAVDIALDLDYGSINDDFGESIENAVLERSVASLIADAYTIGATDIHLCIGKSPKFRVNTVLKERKNEDTITAEEMNRFVGEIAGTKREILEEKRQLDVAYSVLGSLRSRINVFYEQNRLSMSIRVLKNEMPTLEYIEAPDVLKTLFDVEEGLILVTGATGQGKSTTMAAMIDYVNENKSWNIITLEDPIEYEHSDKRATIRQREIHQDVPSFKDGLEACLRQDPDVIAIGESRDYETTSVMLQAAETGHIVVCSMHTMDAPKTIDRMISIFPADMQEQVRVQIANSLKAVISQRIVPAEDRKGMRAMFEVMISNTAIRNHILKKETNQIKATMQSSYNEGMVLMSKSVVQALNDGKISEESALSILSASELAEARRSC